ncbi:questin oxidase family protein [Saccharospirillum sp. HFRX-1]|uniref:questin oxidase family protein n=1 Tax=unclassified Saccharospirillum TaxID=2633430 RepID=UPI0037204451
MKPLPIDHPELANGLTNHVPMVISALKELGASEQVIRRYQDLTAAKLQAITEPPTDISNDSVLQGWLGRQTNYSGLYRYFYQQTQSTDLHTLLNRYLPGLAEGLASRAFHPLIRLGHAVHDRNTEEVAAALAYWVWAYQSLPYPSADQPTDKTPADVFPTLLTAVDWPEHRIDGGPLISDDFLAVTRLPAYQQLRFQLHPQQLELSALRQLAIQAYWMHDDFTLLHGVTSSLAIERLSVWLERPEVLLEPYWKGLVIAWLSKGIRWREVAWPSEPPALSVDPLRQRATQSTNDHTIKLVAACLSLYQQSDDVLYLHAAQRALEK